MQSLDMAEAAHLAAHPRPAQRDLHREDERQGGIPVGRILEANALKRKAIFPSKAAVRERFRGRQPFSSFSAEALQLYIEHSFEVLPGEFLRLFHDG